MPECKSTHYLLYQEGLSMKRSSAVLNCTIFFLHLFFLFNCTFNNHVTLVPNNRCKGPQIPPAEGSTDSGISKVHPLIPSLFLKIDLFSLFAKVTKVTNKVGL